MLISAKSSVKNRQREAPELLDRAVSPARAILVSINLIHRFLVLKSELTDSRGICPVSSKLNESKRAS
jgi:hypothetical protein